MKYIFTILTSCFITLCAIGQNKVIDLEKLKEQDGNWEIIQNKPGRLTYKSQKWLMYFVHWWPLTNDNQNISIEYASDLLKNLWGMQFKMTDNSGEYTVNGHKAYYAEATLRNAVKTRFIVWNCEETGRQFIADCNINLLMKTPEKYFTIQTDEITPNFCCHKSKACNSNSSLKQNINYEDLEISFNLPESWKSNKFLIAKDSSKNIPGYYPNGITKERGSLWNLITDSEKQIDLLWKKSNEELSENMITEFIEDITADTLIEMMDTIKYISVYKNFKNVDISRDNNIIMAGGTFEIDLDIPAYKRNETTGYLHKIFMWKEENTIYFLLTSMIAYEDIWGLPFDLKPSNTTFDNFNKTLLESINIVF